MDDKNPKAESSAFFPLANPYGKGLKESAFNSADTALRVAHSSSTADGLAQGQVSDRLKIRQGVWGGLC